MSILIAEVLRTWQLAVSAVCLYELWAPGAVSVRTEAVEIAESHFPAIYLRLRGG
jgi:hypothetical protein